ncbi:histidine--tRNA ligase [Furfurilactobacillus rossiae]|uniref:Histidine--tRNA ligase n=1 Tax=Furfurilactobacillus rossiae DSM 15814 TaxID=1114972 RepID=A0A0R1RQ43_9LACO|nr:histidine--tRNA ligase [Furfurilactobacillus rossiae]KRL57140.1 histidyl-tRNA synthetase [Furfurilactobacillus rossiae DSM 15814]QFR65971.1 histidine--tRNA ligase [Furfurilactobacillus rossiae]QLE61390.1 Histidyl-tRNA synthetase [Furfurilactobacillus rossiae]
MKYQRPKGTADILPGMSEKWSYVEDTARLLFNDYQFHEIRTPMFENFEVFSRSAGDTSDVVTKEMYDFHDKGDRHIALRPEGTAGVVRAYVENKLYAPEQEKPYKVFYMGPMFRYERPQTGRSREFHQIGVESFGSDSPAVDVEIMAMAMDFFNHLGLTNLKLAVNSLGDKETRAAYHQALVDYLEPHFDDLSEDSQSRLHKNPLRVLDSKDKKDQEIVANAPSILDFMTPDAQKHLDTVKEMLEALKIPFEIDSTMVRGLDYYNHTIFEIETNSPALGHGWMTICGGGRYNGLVEELGGPETPGFGFGIGMERLLLLLDNLDVTAPISNPLNAYVVGIGEETNVETLKLVQAIRQAGFSADRDYLNRKPKAQFKTADRRQAEFTITVGAQELESQTVHFKSMRTGEETTLPMDAIYQDFASVYDKYSEE